MVFVQSLSWRGRQAVGRGSSQRTHFQMHSCGFVRPQVLLTGGYRPQSLARWAFLHDMLTGFPIESNLRGRGRKNQWAAKVEAALQLSFIPWSRKWPAITFAMFCWSQSWHSVGGNHTPVLPLNTRCLGSWNHVGACALKYLPQCDKRCLSFPEEVYSLLCYLWHSERVLVCTGERLLRIMCILHVGERIGPNSLKI